MLDTLESFITHHHQNDWMKCNSELHQAGIKYIDDVIKFSLNEQ